MHIQFLLELFYNFFVFSQLKDLQIDSLNQIWGDYYFLNSKYEKSILKYKLNEGSSCTLIKFGGYINGLNHLCSEFNKIARELVTQSHQKGFDVLAEEHSYEWNKIWDQSDIQIKGDDKAQQGIRFNIFHFFLSLS